MPAFQKFYLRLCIAQGLCLALGFGIRSGLSNFQIEPAQSLQKVAAAANQDQIPGQQQLAADCSAFLGTWALLAGVSGLLLIHSQRKQHPLTTRQPEAVPSAPPEIGLSLFSGHDSTEREFSAKPMGIPKPCVVPKHLLLKCSDDEHPQDLLDPSESFLEMSYPD